MHGRIMGVLLAAAAVACGGSSSGGDTDASNTGGSAGAGGGGATGTGGGTGTGGMGSGGAAVCNPPCGMDRDCCTDHCVNRQNDPQNCGSCGHICQTGTYCGGGQCITPPCNAACSGSLCCGSSCCGVGQLCCDPQGPLDTQPVCATPVNGTCPMGCAPLCVCASPDTLIATPEGERPIASMNVGDLVYSVDHGVMTTARIIRTNRTEVTRHFMTRIVLATGSVLEISALHPTADGRAFGNLRVGDTLDGVQIRAVSVIPYTHDATYDILPDSDSGSYFAGGALVGSTLAVHPKLVMDPMAPLSAW